MTDKKISPLTKKRYASEKRFKVYCVTALVLAMAILFTLLSSITVSSIPAFTQTHIEIDVYLDKEILDPNDTNDLQTILNEGPWRSLAKSSLREMIPGVTARKEKRELYGLVSIIAGDSIKSYVKENPNNIGKKVQIDIPSSDDIDLLIKGLIDRSLPEENRTVTNLQLKWLDQLVYEKRVSKHFAWKLFNHGDSREPEVAGLKGAIVGTLLTMFVTLIISFPIGVMTAVYLEEIAPSNRMTDFIEVNINNLAAVPSIVFGLLGLAVFIGYFDMPRSAPLVGGIVLALMTLPVIIIATRASLASIPPSIREAAYGIGASPLQVITHHVLPLAVPGILTGTIIGIARAAGETAPLLMIGMMAFIVDTPHKITDKATVMPAQIYMWANNPERSFESLTSAAILILLIILITMNGLAIYLRKKYERRW
ncbi:phosphate ABC transporter permease PstA [Hyphomicrobiales bacterium]|jgi:phosphate transport system permease protein|nr:phosphate ABC transporter permease PstA [Hyphomicrobiales bacterium]MDC3272536.1 phosphate ABC transporter permease PstA [Hyphomicrobiales bacterium]